MKNDGGDVVYSVAAVPDRPTGWWRLPTFGATEVEADHLVLWEGASVELHPDFAPSAEGTACQSFVAGETMWAELFIDPSTSQAMAYTCW